MTTALPLDEPPGLWLVGIADRAVAAGVPRAGEGEVLAIGLADDGSAGVQYPRDDRGVDVGHEALQDARAVHHGQAGDAHRVLDGDVETLENALARSLDVAAPVPAVLRIVLRSRPPAGVAGIFHRQALLGQGLQETAGIDRACGQRAVAGEFVVGDVHAESGRDVGQHVDRGHFGSNRHDRRFPSCFTLRGLRRRWCHRAASLTYH
jgi:hypothetical protein